MRSLKSLFEMDSHVWLYCESEALQTQFLEQAEDEGFMCLNGQKPTELLPSRFYGIDRRMTLGYVSVMVWFMSLRYPGHAVDVVSWEHIDPPRVDYGKFIAGDEEYFCYRSDSEE